MADKSIIIQSLELHHGIPFFVIRVSEDLRNSLSKVFGHIAELYDFNVTKCHCNILSNTFLNKLCIQTTPRSGKEPAVKILKLS